MAYILGGKFSHVPETTLVEIQHPAFFQSLGTKLKLDNQAFSEETTSDSHIKNLINPSDEKGTAPTSSDSREFSKSNLNKKIGSL